MVLVIHGGRVMGFWWGHGVPSRRVVVWGGGEILIKTYPGTNLCPPPSYPIRPPAAPFSLFLSLSFHPSRLLSLSNPFSPFLFLLLSRSTLPYPHLPSFLTPSLHSTERSASGSQSRISNGKRVLCAAARIIRMLLAARGKTRSLCRDYVTQPMVYFFESRVKRRKEENIGRCTRFNSSIYVETRQGCNKGRGMILMMTRD